MGVIADDCFRVCTLTRRVFIGKDVPHLCLSIIPVSMRSPDGELLSYSVHQEDGGLFLFSLET